MSTRQRPPPRGSALARALAEPRIPQPTRRQVLALAMLADVDPAVARRALSEGVGVIAGDDQHRCAIAIAAMRGAYRERDL